MTLIETIDALDVREFLASPRHGHFFRTDAAVREKIETRRREFREYGVLRGKTPIVNLHTGPAIEWPAIVELHDGNASCVAWLAYAEDRGLAPILYNLRQAFEKIIFLRDRRHKNGEVWHPFVPLDVAAADKLEPVFDAEQGGVEARKAITREGEVVLFDDTAIFSGEDAAVPLGELAREHRVAFPPPGASAEGSDSQG